MALFESYERRIKQINEVLNSYGIASIEEAEKITKDAGLDVYHMVEKIQPICFRRINKTSGHPTIKGMKDIKNQVITSVEETK